MTKLFFELPKNRELDFRFELPLVTLEVLISMCATSLICREGFFDRKSIIKQFARKSLHLVATIKVLLPVQVKKNEEINWDQQIPVGKKAIKEQATLKVMIYMKQK